MAFGLELGGVAGKLALTIFRIGAIAGIIYWLRSTIKSGTTNVAIWGISLILAGAIGNVLDSLYYGLIFSDSLGRVAEFMPEAGGYAPVLQGKVVDMLYFPLYAGNLPEWVPIWGGQFFTFFRPIFNVADTAISVGDSEFTKAWELNERHYGSLTGLNKEEMKNKLGEKKIHAWFMATGYCSRNYIYS